MPVSGEFSCPECPAPEPAPQGEVFVSYAWTGPSKAIVDQIEKLCKDRSITLHRDKSEMHYKDSIHAFTQRIGRGKCIVVVLSKAYLESKSCMFELTEIAALENIRRCVFPVVLGDANIYDAMGRLGYIKHWEQKEAELDSAIAGIVDILGDMNALTPGQHLGSDFRILLSALEARLSE
jgi:hypothetical protein